MSKRYTTDHFIKLAKLKHGDLFDYSNVVYTTGNDKIDIICKRHGSFFQKAVDHLQGRGCRSCKYEKQSKNLQDDLESFITKAKLIHGDAYCYDKVEYTSSGNKIEIICQKHGSFFQSPNNHINRSSGCPSCQIEIRSNARRLTQIEFIEKSNAIHNFKYDYSHTHYITCNDKISINCPIHGEFTIIAKDHIHNRRGCKICSQGENQPESYIQTVLDDAEVNYIKNDRSLLKPQEIDFLIKSHNIGIEYHGHYFHSQQFGEKSKKYHLEKTLKCAESGIKLIQIFEQEYLKNRLLIKFKIKNLLGLTKYKVYARKCDIREITPQLKQKFNNKYHIQGDSLSCINLGLFYKNRLVQIMTFSKRRKSLGASNVNGHYELSRMSSIKCFNVIGGASKLLKYFEKNYNPIQLISYADRRWSSGNVYHQLGFKLSHVSTPNYWYFHKTDTKKLHHRYKFAKHTLEKQLNVFDNTLSEWENMKINGYDRIWDCGNFVFVKDY